MIKEKCADRLSGPCDWLSSHPPESSDLNPIENAWGLVDQDIIRRDVACHTVCEFKKELCNSWDRIMTPALRRKLVASMRRRFEAVIAAEGGPTRY